jgi:hypothetical protein
MMSNKTAMQEMLEWTRRTLPMDLDTPRMIEAKIESLLAKEKEQIIDARIDGDENHTFNSQMIESYANDYYNETYANDTTKGLPEEDSKRRAWHR